MRIRELLESDDEQAGLVDQVLAVISFLRNRAHDKKVIPSSSTTGLLTMINNTIGAPGKLDFDTLSSLADSNQAIKGVITHLDRDNVQFAPFGDEPGAPKQEPIDNAGGGGGDAKDPTKVVDKMAKRASSKRDF